MRRAVGPALAAFAAFAITFAVFTACARALTRARPCPPGKRGTREGMAVQGGLRLVEVCKAVLMSPDVQVSDENREQCRNILERASSQEGGGPGEVCVQCDENGPCGMPLVSVCTADSYHCDVSTKYIGEHISFIHEDIPNMYSYQTGACLVVNTSAVAWVTAQRSQALLDVFLAFPNSLSFPLIEGGIGAGKKHDLDKTWSVTFAGSEPAYVVLPLKEQPPRPDDMDTVAHGATLHGKLPAFFHHVNSRSPRGSGKHRETVAAELSERIAGYVDEPSDAKPDYLVVTALARLSGETPSANIGIHEYQHIPANEWAEGGEQKTVSAVTGGAHPCGALACSMLLDLREEGEPPRVRDVKEVLRLGDHWVLSRTSWEDGDDDAPVFDADAVAGARVFLGQPAAEAVAEMLVA